MDDKLTGKDIRDQIIQAGMNAIPYVGSPLASLYFGIQNEKRFKRLESFYKELNDELSHNADDIKKLQNANYNEQTAEIINEIHEKIEKEESEKKRIYYKHFFVNNVCNVLILSYEQRKIFLEAIDHLSVLDLDLLRFLIEQRKKIQIGSITRGNSTKYEILGSINRLKHYGFIGIYTGSFVINGSTDNSFNDNVEASDYGKSFYAFINR